MKNSDDLARELSQTTTEWDFAADSYLLTVTQKILCAYHIPAGLGGFAQLLEYERKALSIGNQGGVSMLLSDSTGNLLQLKL